MGRADATTQIVRAKLDLPLSPPPPGANCFRRVCFSIAVNKRFDGFIILCILGNIGSLMCQSFQQSQLRTEVLSIVECAFTAVFFLEAVIKIVSQLLRRIVQHQKLPIWPAD
eukprot:SAG11_NODE_2801_length_2956_cov_1.470774_3_plen_112_part_00